MKKLLIFALVSVIFAGCYGGGTSSGNVKERSFNEQYAELEQETVPEDYEGYTSASGALKNEADRAIDVANEAQRERRGVAPLVESDYIFRVMPDKGTYSFDEYNQVWTDEPKLEDYKNTKRLWKKPQAFRADEIAVDESEGGDSSDEYEYEE